jgi:hypothetical protein
MNILMIFLLFWFVMPAESVVAQDGYMTIEEIEEEGNGYIAKEGTPGQYYPENFTENDYTPLSNLSNSVYSLTLPTMTEIRNELSVGEDENYINLLMNGNDNSVEATQQGKGNIMELEIYADDSRGNVYQQMGNSNFIADKISGNGVNHEIYQFGDHLGVQTYGENGGMQATPMIINQRGQGMQLHITQNPLH